MVLQPVKQMNTENKLKILIVEDEAFTFMMLKKKLEKAGYTVLPNATDRHSAISTFFTHKPDLVIMDINLANGTNGIDAAIEIKRNVPDFPVIYLTAYNDTDTKSRAMKTKPVNFFSKPNEFEAMLNYIDSYLKPER